MSEKELNEKAMLALTRACVKGAIATIRDIYRISRQQALAQIVQAAGLLMSEHLQDYSGTRPQDSEELLTKRESYMTSQNDNDETLLQIKQSKSIKSISNSFKDTTPTGSGVSKRSKRSREGEEEERSDSSHLKHKRHEEIMEERPSLNYQPRDISITVGRVNTISNKTDIKTAKMKYVSYSVFLKYKEKQSANELTDLLTKASNNAGNVGEESSQLAHLITYCNKQFKSNSTLFTNADGSCATPDAIFRTPTGGLEIAEFKKTKGSGDSTGRAQKSLGKHQLWYQMLVTNASLGYLVIEHASDPQNSVFRVGVITQEDITITFREEYYHKLEHIRNRIGPLPLLQK